ncbi:MAG: hypothetical protein KBS96_03395 [Lachnospiraceae bacterium]|nr:hypothetical protein [Candidatus Colinaster scatohippi]
MKNKTINVRNLIAYLLPLIMVVAHIIVMYSLFPGIYYYDIGVQLEQYNSGIFNTSHPLLHTLFVGYFSNLPNGRGYVVATIIQLLLVDSSVYYMLLYVYSIRKKLAAHIFFVCFFAFMPLCSFLTISHTKDILFAAFAIVFVIDMLRFNKCKSTYSPLFFLLFRIRMAINIILVTLLRNNAMYAFLAMLIIIFVIFIRNKKQRYYKELLILLTLSIFLAFASGKALVKITDANPGSIKEMMSIPCQIMARIYNTSATESEKEVILSYIAKPEDYQYYLADHIKMQLEFDVLDSKCKHFLLDTAIIAIHHPIDSLLAVWYNIQGFFDPLHCPYSSDHFFLVPLEYRGGAVMTPKWPDIYYSFYINYFFTSENLSHTPLIIFFNMATYIWIYIISFIASIRKKQRYARLSYLFPLLYLGTLLLGPGAIIRYGFMFILLLPVAWMNITNKQ